MIPLQIHTEPENHPFAKAEPNLHYFVQNDILPETNNSTLKIGDWETRSAYVQGCLLPEKTTHSTHQQ